MPLTTDPSDSDLTPMDNGDIVDGLNDLIEN